MKQYCRYCAFCFDSGDDYRCSNHPKGKQLRMDRKQINKLNSCPNFALSDLGDVETGKQYNPRKVQRKNNRKQITFDDLERSYKA